MSGTIFGSGRTGVSKAQPPPIANLEEDQGQEGSHYKVLVIGGGGDSYELGKEGWSAHLWETRKGIREKMRCIGKDK